VDDSAVLAVATPGVVGWAGAVDHASGIRWSRTGLELQNRPSDVSEAYRASGPSQRIGLFFAGCCS
jgi:hypothetical protein